MKALRRSMKGDKDKPHHLSITPKTAVAIVPPKKVIRALYDYEARSSQELGFSRGDFFHVIGRENDTDWYEACNPALPDARGLVPVAFFQALGRTEGDSADGAATPRLKNPDHDSGYSDSTTPMPNASTSPTMAANSQRISKTPGKQGAMVYGVVMYDFKAERADELEANTGEAVIVIAQSNPEWFVAKPIGRLGGPGLIPVSFIEIRDMATNTAVVNPQDAIKKAGVPKVEEWKKMAADYKNSSITLGKFDSGGPPGSGGPGLEQGMDRLSIQQQSARNSQQNSAIYQQQQQAATPPQQMSQSQQQQPRPQQQEQEERQEQQRRQSVQQQPMQQQSNQPQSDQYASHTTSQALAPISARIPRFCCFEREDEKKAYWFVIAVQLEDGRHWELSRYYEDFYDFQIALLTEFPTEAGNTGTQKRTLPYMPGPVNWVSESIMEGRLHNLDAYVKNLLAQPAYISKSPLVKQFFAPREGDYPANPDGGDDDYRLSAGSQQSSSDSRSNGASRQSSRNNLNGNNGYSGLTALGAPMNGGQAGMTRQASSYSQQGSQMSMGNAQGPGKMTIIKIKYRDEFHRIPVPEEVTFVGLQNTIRERLKFNPNDDLQLSVGDATTDATRIRSNGDLDAARPFRIIHVNRP